MSKNEKKSFILYHSFANQLELLSMEERGQLISAIFAYERTGEIDASLSPLVKMAFSCMKEALDRDRESYEAKCKQNTKNGKKGGRPKKDSSLPKTERFFEEPEKADNENGNENDNENENDDDNDTEEEERACADGNAPRFAPHSAPPLSEEEQKRLLARGLPEGYVEERRKRAEAYATRHGKEVCEVLLSWWKDDRAKPPWNQAQKKPCTPTLGNAFDTDDFFEAALRRSFREIGITDG